MICRVVKYRYKASTHTITTVEHIKVAGVNDVILSKVMEDAIYMGKN